jgi:PAS domain S-box-containing protein
MKEERHSGTRLDSTASVILQSESFRSDQEELRVLFEEGQRAGNIGTWQYNIRTREVWCSKECYRIFGLDDSGLITLSRFYAIILDSDKPKLIFYKLCEQNNSCEIEFRILKNGETRWICCSAAQKHGENGQPLYVCGTIMDITGRKQMEEEVRKSREELEHLKDMLERSQAAGHVGSWQYDIRSRDMWLSDEALRIFGLGSGSRVPVLEVLSRVLEEDREKVNSEIFSLAEPVISNCEYRITPDGSLRWLRAKGEIQYDHNGAPETILGTVMDITVCKKAEEEVKKSEEKFKTVADWTYTWEYWVNPSGEYIYVSPSCEQVSGYTREQFVKVADLVAIIHPEDRGKFSDHVEYCTKLKDLNDTSIQKIQFRILHKNGGIRSLEHLCRGVYTSDGTYLGRRASVRDITSELQAQEIRMELGRTKEMEHLRAEFFANISHELRMPLTIIFSSLQLIEPLLADEADLKKEMFALRRNFNYIRQNCYRMLKLVNNLIDITRIESGFMQLVLQNCDVVDIARQIASSVETTLKGKGISMCFAADMPERRINCDPDKLERILLNLLSNAAKYTPSGGRIGVHVLEKNGNVLIEVSDTGEGIPREKQDVIFERFRQADNSFSRSHEGSGIGLSIADAMAKLHCGKITLTSEVGKGSVFTLELPADLQTEHNTLRQDRGLKWLPRVFSVNVEFSDIYS